MNANVVSLHNGEGRAGTFLISKGFKRSHDQIKRLVRKYEQDFLEFGPLHLSKVRSKGRPVEELLLNEDQTLFLGTLLRNSDPVIEFKKRLVKLFSECRKKLLELENHKQTEKYQITRDAGKILRIEATDTMKEFVEYARYQGSKNPENYYMLFTKMVNGLLFIVEGKFKNLREVMTTQQLMTTGTAEQVITKGITEGMKNKVFYKDVYIDVKSRVMAFAGLTGQSKVIEDHLRLE